MLNQRLSRYGVITALLLILLPAAASLAQETVVFGFGPAAAEGFGGEPRFEGFLENLRKTFARDVTVRMFERDEDLYRWLVRFREVDLALLDAMSLVGRPSGEVLPLIPVGERQGQGEGRWFVARQGLDARLLQDVRAALKSAGLEGSLPVMTAAPDPGVREPAPPEVSAVETATSVEASPQSFVSEETAARPTAADAAGPAVTLEADRLSYDQQSGDYEASGHVLLRQGNVSLEANRVLLQSSTQDVVATGDVTIRQADDSLNGERIRYNLSTGTGLVRQGRVRLSEKNFRLTGNLVEKSGEATYHVSQGSFTTCDGDVPDWTFTADKVDLTLGRYARARGAWFRVRDVPLLYFPYLIYPVKTERESGLLPPRFGYSSDNGMRSSLAWYQVIARNQDATLFVDHYSEKGLGKGVEYRYLFGEDNAGEARYDHVSGVSGAPDLYALEWRHDGTLPGGVHLAADVDYVEDVRFFEDFGEVADEYNRDKALSTLILQRNWSKLNLAGHLRYLKDLEGDNDETLQQLPELSAVVPRYRFRQTPLYLGLESYATRFRSDRASQGERFLLRPSAGAMLKLGSWFELAPEVALTQRYYDAEAQDDEVVVPAYALTLSSRLQKVFPFRRWGIMRLRHSIEPEISYQYVPPVDQEGLPWFDRDDRQVRRNSIAYALVNRFTARLTNPDGLLDYRDVLWLRLSQSYDVDEARDDTIADQEPFSDLRVELDLRPVRSGFLEIDARIAAHNALVFNQLDIDAGMEDDAGNRLVAGYVFRRELIDDPQLSTDYLRAIIDTSLLEPVYLHLEERYDFEEEGALETRIGLEYRSRCWSLVLAYRDRPEDEQVMVTFILAGLGNSEGFW